MHQVRSHMLTTGDAEGGNRLRAAADIVNVCGEHSREVALSGRTRGAQ